MVGKRRGQSIVAAATGHCSGLLFLLDIITKQRFLVNTGAEVSVYPATGLDTRLNQPGAPLVAANGTTIQTFGTRELVLHLLFTDGSLYLLQFPVHYLEQISFVQTAYSLT